MTDPVDVDALRAVQRKLEDAETWVAVDDALEQIGDVLRRLDAALTAEAPVLDGATDG